MRRVSKTAYKTMRCGIGFEQQEEKAAAAATTVRKHGFCVILSFVMLAPRPSTAPASRSHTALAKAKPLQRKREPRSPSENSSRPHQLHGKGAGKKSDIGAIEEEICGTVSRLRGLTGWNWGQHFVHLWRERNQSNNMCTAAGVFAGIELRSYSIAASAMRRLVTDASMLPLSQPLSGLKSPLHTPRAPNPPLADADEGGVGVTSDLNLLLKHVQRSSPL
jgi:hypothetical protein